MSDKRQLDPPRRMQETLGPPRVDDGGDLWRLARASGALDLNSPYAYLIWCRDFADTSVVARRGDQVVGFTIGYVRPRATDTVVAWQIGVDENHRRSGLALRMLHYLADRLLARGTRFLEATVTPDNEASNRLFSTFARARSAALNRRVLFDTCLFPDDHETEVLLRIGPFTEQ